MGEHLEANSAEIRKTESDLKSLTDSLEFQLAQAAVDVVGIADPTPISDLTSAGMSIASGDWLGAGLSVVSAFPYLGDALAKTAKGARLLKKLDGLRKGIAGLTAKLNKLRKAAHAKAAEAVRAERKAKAAKKAAAQADCEPCKAAGNRFGTRLPKTKGKWEGEPGNGRWFPDPNENKELYDALPADKKFIEFREGYPDFSPHRLDSVPIEMTGSSKDFTLADQAMREKLGDPSWRKPEGYTWHHNEDGVTMELVPSDINNKVPHTGGDSIRRDPEF